MRAATAQQPPTELLNRYFRRILGVAYQTLGDAALASNAATATFTQLRPNEGDDPVAIWGTALNVIRSYLARGLHIVPLSAEGSGWQTSILNCLASLEPDDRLLLLLRYHEGLRYDQMATVFGMDQTTLRQAVASARGRLVEQLRRRDALR